jgi:DNA-binding beta-propeller fold protein YncE
MSVIDTATNKVIDTISLGGNPAEVAVSPNGRHIYVTNQRTGVVSVITRR